MIPEASLERTEHGLTPRGEGWYVLNAREAVWKDHPERAAFTHFEGDVEFPQLGINVNVLSPGQPLCRYHYEVDQEDFFVLAGEALLVVEEEERPLRQWDFVHCPPGTKHVLVGAGTDPCVILAVGARIDTRGEHWGAYTVSEAAARYGASVERETTDASEAYAAWPSREPTAYRDSWLPS